MIELWRNPLSRKKKMFTEAFSTIDHSLLIENLSGYSSSVDLTKMYLSYLQNRKQRTVIENRYSSWKKVIACAPQSSIFGPFLFNIFVCDLFLFLKYCNLGRFDNKFTCNWRLLWSYYWEAFYQPNFFSVLISWKWNDSKSKINNPCRIGILQHVLYLAPVLLIRNVNRA